MPAPLLSIAIPTFDRPEEAASRVRELSSQLLPYTTVEIFENGRTERLSNLLNPFLSQSIRYRPSPINAGFLRNFLRCIEEGDSEWVWILGDDDAIHADAVTRVVEAIKNTNSGVVCYKSFSRTSTKPTVANTIDAFLENITLSEALFISGTLWRRDIFLNSINTYMEGASTMQGHLIVLLQTIENGKETVEVRDERLTSPTRTSHRWSRLKYMRCAPFILDCFAAKETREIVARHLWVNWLWAATDSTKEISDMTSFEKWKKAYNRGYRRIAQEYKIPGYCSRQMLSGALAFLKGNQIVDFPHFLNVLPKRLAFRHTNYSPRHNAS